MDKVIRYYKELDVFQNAMKAAMEIFKMTREFPNEERYSLVDQIRRSSRSVCSNLAEAWHKRKYRAAFVSKLSDAESESAETQVWLEFARQCAYITDDVCNDFDDRYSKIIAQLIKMSHHSEKWLIKQ